VILSKIPENVKLFVKSTAFVIGNFKGKKNTFIKPVNEDISEEELDAMCKDVGSHGTERHDPSPPSFRVIVLLKGSPL